MLIVCTTSLKTSKYSYFISVNRVILHFFCGYSRPFLAAFLGATDKQFMNKSVSMLSVNIDGGFRKKGVKHFNTGGFIEGPGEIH